MARWNADIWKKEKAYFQDIPSMIIWELCMKEGKQQKHNEKNILAYRVKLNITRNQSMLLKVRRPNQDFIYTWPDILKEFEHSRPKVKVSKVI